MTEGSRKRGKNLSLARVALSFGAVLAWSYVRPIVQGSLRADMVPAGMTLEGQRSETDD